MLSSSKKEVNFEIRPIYRRRNINFEEGLKKIKKFDLGEEYSIDREKMKDRYERGNKGFVESVKEK
jgi:hypothetical protein